MYGYILWVYKTSIDTALTIKCSYTFFQPTKLPEYEECIKMN